MRDIPVSDTILFPEVLVLSYTMEHLYTNYYKFSQTLRSLSIPLDVVIFPNFIIS